MKATFACAQLNVSCVIPLHNIFDAVVSPEAYQPRETGEVVLPASHSHLVAGMNECLIFFILSIIIILQKQDIEMK
jgi:hypothetical protein